MIIVHALQNKATVAKRTTFLHHTVLFIKSSISNCSGIFAVITIIIVVTNKLLSYTLRMPGTIFSFRYLLVDAIPDLKLLMKK
jgi:hypothetical protein